MTITLTGANDVLRDRELKRITNEFVAAYSDMGLERLDGEEASYERMLGAANSLPFLAARKLVILRTPSANKQFVENFEKFLGDVAETNDVILVEPKLDKRLGYYKLLKKITDFHDFAPLDNNNLAQFLADYASQQGGTLSVGDAHLLIERVGANELTLVSELNKLLAYDQKITHRSIELLTEKSPQSNIFDLLDAAFSGDSKKAIGLYKEQRAKREEPQKIMSMIIWQLYILALIKTAGNRSSADVASAAKLNPYVVSKSMDLARRLPLARLRQLVSSLCEFDTRLKSESLDADEVLQYYLLSISRP